MTRTHFFLGLAAALTATAALIGPKPRLPSAWLTDDATAHGNPARDSGPLDLALVLDRSGSMAGVQLRDTKAAAIASLSSLGPRDRLAIIHFGSTVRVFPSRAVGAKGHEDAVRFIGAIEDSGGTDLYAGLKAGIEQVTAFPDGEREVVLVTNGEPTSGITDPSAFDALTARARTQGVSVVTIGLGSDADAPLLKRIAAMTNGRYVPVARPEQLTEILHDVFSRARARAEAQVATL